MAIISLELGKYYQQEYLIRPALNALGKTCILLKDYAKPVGYLKREASIACLLGVKESLAYSKNDFGVAYTGLRALDYGSFMECKALKIFKEIYLDELLVYLALGGY